MLRRCRGRWPLLLYFRTVNHSSPEQHSGYKDALDSDSKEKAFRSRIVGKCWPSSRVQKGVLRGWSAGSSAEKVNVGRVKRRSSVSSSEHPSSDVSSPRSSSIAVRMYPVSITATSFKFGGWKPFRNSAVFLTFSASNSSLSDTVCR